MTPRKMASELKMSWHNLAHFFCARFYHSKYCLFLIPPTHRHTKLYCLWQGTSKRGKNNGHFEKISSVNKSRLGSGATWA